MSIQEDARSMVVRQHQQIKNRQQSMLMRAAQEFGLSAEISHYWNPTQGKIDSAMRSIYSSSNIAMS
jgi:uncharacterized membrane protein